MISSNIAGKEPVRQHYLPVPFQSLEPGSGKGTGDPYSATFGVMGDDRQVRNWLRAIHLLFGMVERWLLGTHHGAVSATHLRACLDGHVSRLDRRIAKSPAHRSLRVTESKLNLKD